MNFIPILLVIELINGLDEFVEQPRDYQVLLGSDIVLPCRTKLIYQNQVNWCKNDFCTLGKTRDLPFYPRYRIIGNILQGEHHFQIRNFSLEDVGTYQCQIRAQYQRPAARSRKAKLTLLQIPTNVSIDNPIELIENVQSNVICRSSNAMPEARLSWSFPPSLNPISISDYVLINDKALRNSISNLTFTPTRSLHQLLIQCQANSSAIHLANQTIQTQQIIHILFKPQLKLFVIGQLIENERIEIEVKIESRPDVSSIKWFMGNDLLSNENNRTNISWILHRSHFQKQILCQVQNSIGMTNQSIQLNFIYRPRFVDEHGNEFNESETIKLVSENERIQLNCSVDSFPLLKIFWMFNNEILLENHQEFVRENISLDKHLGRYECCVEHEYFGFFNRSFLLKLKSPPEFVSKELSYSTSIHQSIEILSLLSKDLPIQDIQWFKHDQIPIESNEKYEIRRKEEKHLIESRLKIKDIQMDDEGMYQCRSSNLFGSSIQTFEVKIEKNLFDFVEKQMFYLSIFVGLFLSFLFFFFIFKFFFSSSKTPINHDQQIILQQSLIQNHLQDLLNPDEDYYSSKRYSTVV